MKYTRRKKTVTFGDYVVAAYNTYDKRLARGVVWLAVNAHLIEFQNERILISSRGPDYSPSL